MDDLKARAERALSNKAYEEAHRIALHMLQGDSASADGFYVLAIIALEHGNFVKALEILDKLLIKHPGDCRLLVAKARCLTGVGKNLRAAEVIDQAWALQPDDAYLLDTIGVVFTRAGQHARAIAPFRAAIARDPNRAGYWYNLASSLQFSGEFTEAESSYRQALNLDPGYYRAWSALSALRKNPLSAADQEAIKTALSQQELEPDAALHLCHALAKQLEDEGGIEQSLSYLHRAKRSKERSLNYAFAQDQALFDAAIQSGQSQNRSSLNSERPVFIVGLPRSGTTLIERILSSHPDVVSAGELSDFTIALKRLSGTPGALVLDAPTLFAGTQVNMRALGEAYLESIARRQPTGERVIDKMPLNFFCAQLIHRALPNARIIAVRRHPYDVVLANYRQLFATQFNYYRYAYNLKTCAQYWQRFDQLLKHWQQMLPPDRYTEVHYEHIVQDTEAQARRLIEFLDLPWDPACLEFHKNEAPVATASSVQVRQPVYTSSLARWKKYLPYLPDLSEWLGAPES